MSRNLSSIWWLLALAGVLEAIYAAMNTLMMNPEGSFGFRTFAGRTWVWDMSMVALVAAACMIAVGVWNSGKNNSWLLSLHGLALGGFGAIGVSPLVKGRLSFRPFSLLFLLMAVSLGAFAFRTARALPSSASYKWILRLSGAILILFAISFPAVGFGEVRLRTPQSYWIWMGCYFGFCAIFMLWIASWLYRQYPFESRRGKNVAPVITPRLAH